VVDPTTDSVDTMVERFRNFAHTSRSRAPLYAALSSGIAAEPELAALLLQAPETQRQPVLLLVCVHHLLLDEQRHPLARWYPNLVDTPRSPDEPELMATFEEFVGDHRDALCALLASRSTQTNEVGRCAVFVPAFGIVADEMGALGHLDVGASGGLNLLVDRYRYRYTREGTDELIEVGPESPVVMTCSIRGEPPVPRTVPPIVARYGIDRSPFDITDPVESCWLEACVWPDQADRFHRLEAAIELAREHRPMVAAGDAVGSLAAGIAEVGISGHPVVTNSWVLNYLTAPERIAYLAELDRIGAERDLTWVFVEAPALVPELPAVPEPGRPDETVLTMVRWRSGRRVDVSLATCHPHGYWLHWR
jgi:hypothetical protein